MMPKIIRLVSLVSFCLLSLSSLQSQTVTLLNEDFSSSSFSTNGWNFPNGQSYWSVNTFYTPTAAISPNALFFPPTTPTVSNYNVPLVSSTINASSVSGVVYFSFALRLQGFNSSATGTEFMDVEYKVVGASSWTPIVTYTNNLTGLNQNYGLSNYMLSGVSGQNFQVRFVARGANTYNIAGWGLDNILITGANCPSSLPGLTISASSNSVCAGSSVSITATGGGPSYTWSPSNTNGTMVTVSPTTTSSYALISSFPGCTTTPVTALTTITVFSNPSTLSISNSTSTICSGSTVTLSASGSGSYTWSPGGITSSLATVSPTSSTIYTVVATNSLNCVNLSTVSIGVNPSPTLGVFASTTAICPGSSANLIASGASSYSWSNGSSGAIVAVSPTATSQYTVVGTSTAGCSTSGTIAVAVSPPISVSASSTLVCSGNQVTLVASGANSYVWSNGSTGSSLSVSPVINTICSVSGTNSMGCISSSSVQLTIDPSPSLTISNSSPSVCSGQSITLQASGANTYTWTNYTPGSSIVVSPTVTSTFTVSGKSLAGCTGPGSTATVQVIVKPSPTLSVFGSSNSVCSGVITSLTATGANSYSWTNLGIGNTVTVSPPAGINIYTVTGTNSAQCSSQATLVLNVLPSPSLALSASSLALCAGGSATLLATGANLYSWSNGSTVNVIYVSPLVTTVFTVTGSNQNNCSSSLTVQVTVNAYPIIQVANLDSLICAGEPASLVGSGADYFVWNGVAGNDTTVVFPSTTSVYTVQGISNGCATETSVTQHVETCEGLKEQQNELTGLCVSPNPGSGLFFIAGTMQKTVKLEILNSLGQEVYTSTINENTRVDLGHCTPGIYYFRFSNEGQAKTMKVMRE